MRKIFLLTILLLQSGLVAQNNLNGVVNYGHKQSFGMGAPIGIDYNAELIFNIVNSTYTFAKDSLEGGHKSEMSHVKNDKRHFMIMKRTTNEGFIYNMNRNTNLIQSRDVGFNYVKDSIPKIDWTIGEETKQIESFLCMKATCSFRGRDYTAWFSLDIPLPFGPWKLQGLPGLILEAYDTDKEIYFYFKSIEYPSKKEIKIIVPDPEKNTDMEKNKPTTVRSWISFEEFKNEMLRRHQIGTKMGRIFSEQSSIILSAENTVPMKNVYIEIFDE